MLPVLFRDKKDATLIYKKEICLYIFVTSGDQPIFVSSMVFRYNWFYKVFVGQQQNTFIFQWARAENKNDYTMDSFI